MRGGARAGGSEVTLDGMQTLAVAVGWLLAGREVHRRVPALSRANIPAGVTGGLLAAFASWALRAAGHPVALDASAREPLMLAFFTSVGMNASVAVLRRGGPQVFHFLALATGAAVLQNLLGAALSLPFGLPPLTGVLAGSVTLTGGPATGLAFAPLFQEAGVANAAEVAVAAAMVGIVMGGLIGGPLATGLIERHRLRGAAPVLPAPDALEQAAAAPARASPEPPLPALLRSFSALVVAMVAGGLFSKAVAAAGFALPATVGAMVAGAALRNLDDATGWLGLDLPLAEGLGDAALTLFLPLALATLQLWTLVALAVPLLAMLALQLLLVAALVRGPLFRWMGGDYEAAVMGAGFAGFMLGTTANAMANMRAITARYGPAPRAFLVVPTVGALFIDFVNALLIALCLNVLR